MDYHLGEDCIQNIQLIHRHCIHTELCQNVWGTKQFLSKYILSHMENKNKTEDYSSNKKCYFYNLS